VYVYGWGGCIIERFGELIVSMISLSNFVSISSSHWNKHYRAAVEDVPVCASVCDKICRYVHLDSSSPWVVMVFTIICAPACMKYMVAKTHMMTNFCMLFLRKSPITSCRRQGRNKTDLGRECLARMQEHVRRLPCGQGQGYARTGLVDRRQKSCHIASSAPNSRYCLRCYDTCAVYSVDYG